jgi:hypothetical protein
MKSTICGLAAGLATLALAASPALAQNGGGAAMQQMLQNPDAVFAAADADKNDEITKEEWLAAGRREQGFNRFDANGDGKLVKAEWAAAVEAMKQMAGQRGQ